MKVVLDSNILIAALNLNDTHHSECAELVQKLTEGSFDVIAPVTGLWEMDAYVKHPDKMRGHDTNETLTLKVTHYDVTHDLFLSTYTSSLVAVKALDRIFVSLAKLHNAPLITNDRQILANAPKLHIVAFTAREFIDSEL